ncbi:MAG TPA: cupin domain-containing protein [Polyangia bacterium]|nr:cupin domain-containing protein [Polyangia bacterium]
MNDPRVVLTDLVNRAKRADFTWEPLRPGIEIHRLYGGERGPSAAVLRYAPGAKLALHEHPGYEHIFILEGAQVDDHGRYDAPSFIVNPPGSTHSVTSPDGCLVLVIWQEPVRFA